MTNVDLVNYVDIWSMSNVKLLAMIYCDNDVIALIEKHVAPIYFVGLNMKDMLYWLSLDSN